MDKIKCSKCDGSGKVRCETCDGSGKVGCKSCKGVGHVACPACEGKGKKYVKCHSCHDGYNIDPDDDRKVKCAKCNGTGKIESGTCSDCNGSGKVPCKDCSGSGKTECSECHGEGTVVCSKCHGKGGVPVDEYCLSLIGPDGMLVDRIDDYELLGQAAQSGSGVAAYVIGIDAECEGGDEDDFMDNFRISAKANFVWGNYELGRLLFCNDDPEAIVFLQKAFDQGSVLAAGYLGVSYYWGRCGLSKDISKAVELCKAYKGSPYEKEEYSQLDDISKFMKYVGSAAQGNADSLAWMVSAANALLPNGCEKESLEILKSAVEKGAQNLDLVFKKSGLHFAEGEIKALKERLDQDRRQKEEAQKAKNAPPTKSTKPIMDNKQPNGEKACCSSKRRWKYIVLGLFLGWMGAHYMYAKRIVLLALLWVSFIAGVAMIGSNGAIGGGCIALWGLLWLGGTFFVKKDSKGNRM